MISSTLSVKTERNNSQDQLVPYELRAVDCNGVFESRYREEHNLEGEDGDER